MSKMQEMIKRENIEDVEYSEIMGTSYVNYAMSVIIARAVPDVRDGFKPVHRRIIYDMKELGTTSDKPHRKSARTVGDTIGKYHPHGECLSADTLIPLLDGSFRTIKELCDAGDPVWVLAADGTCKVVPVQAHDFRIGQYATKLYNIEFTDGSSITVTGNHPFLTIDGEWVIAENLHPNMLLSTGAITRAYERNDTVYRPAITYNLHHRVSLQHVAAGNAPTRTSSKDEAFVVHHLDDNPLNNTPSNLIWLTRSEHAKAHQAMSTTAIDALRKGSETIRNDAELQEQRKQKNKILSSIYAKYSGVYTAYNILAYMKSIGMELTQENYESFRQGKKGKFYNVPYIHRLVEKGFIESFEDLVRQYLSGDTIQSRINFFDHVNYESRHPELRDPSLKVKSPHVQKRYPQIRMLLPLVRLYRDSAYSRDVKYEDLTYKDGRPTALHTYMTEDEFPEFRDTYLSVIKRITVQEIETPQPMYDFTVDDYHNMFICRGSNENCWVVAHNSAVYDAMVVMSQPWKKGKTLVDGHGNFGSIEGDSAAAQRYTEAKLERFSEDVFLEDLKYDTVDMVPNYDETEKEPEVLPCKLPHILINGSEGIAVGMTTSIPTHNVGEVIDTAIAYLRGTHDVAKLMKTLPGPDFPTGGIISNGHDISSIYNSGVGKIKIRGKIEFEKGTGTEKDRLIITEIPYTMIGEGINRFLHDVAALVEDKMLPEIHDIINQSTGDQIRIVLELRPNANIERIKNILYKKTKLEDTFGVNMLVIDHGRPVVMNLIQILDAFEKFQYQIYTRKYQKLLSKAEKKREIDDGLITAIDMIDVIIAVLRGNKDPKEVRRCLQTGDTSNITFKTKTLETAAKKFRFTEDQTQAIMDMPLSRLVGLEADAIRQDRDKVQQSIDTYNKLLTDPEEMKKDIIKFLQQMKKQYSRDRRTEIADIETPDVAEVETPEVELVVLMDKFNYILSVEKSAYLRNKQFVDENFVRVIPISSKDKLAVFTDVGKVHLIPMKEIPLKKPRDKGVPLDNICQFDYKSEQIVGVEALGFKKEEKTFVFVMSSGLIKRTKNSEFFINRKVTDSTLMKEGDKVFIVFTYNPASPIIFETEKGLVLREDQSNIKLKSKYSQGVQGIKLNAGDSLKIVTSDLSPYRNIRKGSFGTTGKVRTRKLI